jgi:outer membrane protein OmpU
MNKLTKILVVITSSLAMSFAAVAGELTVTGSAKASYHISGGDNSDSKGLGIGNELMFSASGELDNGYTWNYHTEIDPAAGGATLAQDDSALTINTNGMGTVGIFDSEGGLSSELAHGIGALGTGTDYGSTWGASGNTASAWGFDVSSHPNVQYHTPADLLPYGITLKYGFVPNTADTQGNSFKSTGGENTQGPDGDSAQQIRIDASPIDGLKVGGDYIQYMNETVALDQEKSGGNIYAQYATGNFKFGAFMGYTEDALSTYAGGDGTSYDRQETESLGVEFAVNENLSVSVSEETHSGIDKGTIAVGATSKTKFTTDMKATIYQIAYNVGGATIGLFHNSTDNSDFVASKEEKKTAFVMSMEF